ncbi:hypothetical protein ACVIGB_000806 [Bradyrhizobium sp. USDA 4341]
MRGMPTRAMLLGVYTALLLSVAAMLLVYGCQLAAIVAGIDPVQSPLVLAAAAFVEWDLPCFVGGYVAARVGRLAPIQSVLLTCFICLSVDLGMEFLEVGWEGIRESAKLLSTSKPSAMVVLGAMIAVPVNVLSRSGIEGKLVPILTAGIVLLVAGGVYAVGLWAALSCGPLTGLASVGAMMIAMAATIGQTEQEKRHALALVLLAVGWAAPAMIIACGVALGLQISDAVWLLFFQTMAVLCGYAWLFRLFPEEFTSDAAPFWARRFMRVLVWSERKAQ